MNVISKIYTASDGSGLAYKPRANATTGEIFAHRASGLYIYDSSLALKGSATGYTAYNSCQDANYLYVFGSSGLLAYTWDGSTLTSKGSTFTSGDISVDTDGTYVYASNGGRIFMESFDGTNFTDVDEYLMPDLEDVYDLRCLSGHIVAASADRNLYVLYRRGLGDWVVNSYSYADYWPEHVCSDGSATIVYTDNAKNGYASVWKFAINTTTHAIALQSFSGDTGNTRGVCWNSDDSTVITMGLLDEQVKEYDPSTSPYTKLGESVYGEGEDSTRGCTYYNGRIYTTTNGTTMWGSGAQGAYLKADVSFIPSLK